MIAPMRPDAPPMDEVEFELLKVARELAAASEVSTAAYDRRDRRA